jgi:hypothetical protein
MSIVVTVLFSSEARGGFESVVEGNEEFSHDSGQGEFVRFAFCAKTLIKARQDGIVTSGD